MYENMTYAELKKLPDVERQNAWKELTVIYPTKKELAQKFGVSIAVIYNNILKYVKGKPTEKTQAEKQEAIVKRPRKTKSLSQPAGLDEKSDKLNPVDFEIKNPDNAPQDELFSIDIKKTVSGEDAQFFLNGIGGTLLRNQKYTIEVRITE